jgi:hypothetical protein
MELALIDQVEKLAERERRSKSLVVETAVASFFSPDSADRREAAIARRLDVLTRQFERIDRHLTIFAEYLNNVVRLWIVTALPALTTPDKAARVKSFELQATLLRYVARRLARGRNVIQEISEDIEALRSDVSDDKLTPSNVELES